jgi:hypothetical protein
MKENEGERAMDAGRNDHPDEGTIHAWLDGALDAPTASALEAHVASCTSCTERVAEARGLIAGASRVVGALDDVPSGVAPAWGRPSSTARSSRRVSAWRRLRVTPARAAIAATLLIALGVTLTKQHIAPETDVAPRVAATSAQRAAPIRPHDALLDSAVKRNVAAAVPPRGVQAAPGPNLAVPLPGSQPPAVAADTTAGLRVAVGRTSMRTQVEAGIAADRAAVSGAPAGVAREPERRALAASIKADSAAALSVPASKEVPEQRLAVAPECYRVESANGTPAAWGAVPLPFVVALDPIGRSARLFADGISDGRVTWTRAGDDSLTFHLRRIGYTGTLTLGSAGDVRPGVMRSAPLKLELGETVVTGAASAEDVPPGKSAPAARAKAPTMVPGPTKPAAAPPPPQKAAAAEPAIAVVARRVGCAH